ncbi:hypothetical protein [Leeuwenhoekiella sp. W20_SRS_FM14]|uniref:hypothetical protein n=1 Tax=Leeuwenhoekiella sp. W20_SRS_FM14 TaxID=3240270 RepID=UPI003F9A4B4B
MKRSLKIRITVFLVLMNCVALSVNYFGISPKIKATAEHKTVEIFLFTDSEIGLKSQLQQVGYLEHTSDGFWPFEAFYVNTSVSATDYTARFRGFFAGFDFSEFVFYNSMLLGTLLFLRLW